MGDWDVVSIGTQTPKAGDWDVVSVGKPQPSLFNRMASQASKIATKGIEAPLVNPISSRLQQAGEKIGGEVEGIGQRMMDKAHEFEKSQNPAISELAPAVVGPAGALTKFAGQFGQLTPQNLSMMLGGEAAARIGLPAIADLFGQGVAKTSGALTGTGDAVGEAFNAGREGGAAQEALKGTMRGKVSESNVVNDAMDALQKIKDQRGEAYRTAKEGIEANTFQKQIDLTPVKTHLDDLLDKYNIARSPDGKLDFSRTPISNTEASKVKEIAELVDQWGTQPGDNTVKGLDILKRKIKDFYSPSSEARAFVTSLGSKVKKTIVDAVPEYEGMVKGYEDASDAIKDISKELSLNPNASEGTVMRKLKQIFRDNFDLRREFVQKLEEAGKGNLIPQIAGSELSPIMPKGIMKSVAGGDILASLGLHDPRLLAGLPLTSPRLAGETALAAGQATRVVEPIVRGLIGGNVPTSSVAGRVGLAGYLKKK